MWSFDDFVFRYLVIILFEIYGCKIITEAIIEYLHEILSNTQQLLVCYLENRSLVVLSEKGKYRLLDKLLQRPKR